MKKFLSLMMVVAMLFAVLAFVGCNNDKNDDTTASSTTSGTTSGTTEGTTSGSTEGTTSGTTEGTTTSSESDTTNSSETTTLPNVFARFDFGTATKAEALEMTSHAYLTSALTYDDKFISVETTADTIIVTALVDHPEIKTELDEDGDRVEKPDGYAVTSYALCFDDIVTYDFADELKKDKNFMRVRVKNNSTNNMMSVRFRRPSDSSYFTTTMFTCMYLQAGAPGVDDYVAGDKKLVAEAADTDFKVYTYDINFLAAMGRSNTRGEKQGNSYVHMAYYVGTGGGTGSNNWNWSGENPICALQFFVLGAYGGPAYCPAFEYGDTRANIKAGNSVEIDYITFGAKADLNSFKSYLEDAYDESVSISKSISVSESEAAAATATTAAAA